MAQRDNKQAHNLQSNQDGLVAIVVTFIIMLLLTLIITGFAQLARREQREALDRQLATQAFYAAESGINAGRKLLQAKKDAGVTDYEKPNCGQDTTDPLEPNPKLDGADGVFEYTCLLIKRDLNDSIFQTSVTNKSVVTPVEYDTAVGTIDKIIVSWHNTDGSKDVDDSYAFNTAGDDWANSAVSMLRLEVVPYLDGVSGTDDETLRGSRDTFFAIPRESSANPNFGRTTYNTGEGIQGRVEEAKCGATVLTEVERYCRMVIEVPAGFYYLRFRPIHNTSDVRICPGSVTSGDQCDDDIKLKNGQTEIDSTGRANDVLKRLKVRVNKSPGYNGSLDLPEYTLDSTENICKPYDLWPNGSRGTCP